MWFEQGFFWVPLIIMIASCVRSMFGFGDSLLAMPLLLGLLSPETAVVVVAGLCLAHGTILIIRERSALDLSVSARLLAAALVGVPFGLWGVQVLPASVIRVGVSVILIGYATQALFKVQLPELKSPVWSAVAGFTSGFCGAAVNISGPPVVLYGTMAKWSPEKFRATLQGFFVPLGVVIVLGHVCTGMWTIERMELMGIGFPAMLLGSGIGMACRGRISPTSFQKVLHVILIIMGGMLAYSALT